MTIPMRDSLPATPASGIPSSPARVELRLALLSIVGFWTFYFLVNTLRAAVLDRDDQWSEVQHRFVVVAAGILLLGILWLVMRRLEGKSLWAMVITGFLAAVPVAGGYATINYVMFDLYAPMQESNPQDQMAHHYSSAELICELAISWYLFFAAWAVLYIALSYAARVRQVERTAALYRAAAQSAQLRALRYQINPHFLFNTLNSLSTLILRQRNDEAERMIMNLASFFRTSLTGDPTEDVTLSEEIRTQQLYLDIEKNRFPERLLITIDVPPELEQALVPGFILQPLVENAIKYGVSRSVDPVTVAIRARATQDKLLVSVIDDGRPSFEAPAGTGVGLRNVTDRLITRFDGNASLTYGARVEGGFRVDITLPLRPELLAAAPK
jgi:two-component sensor histidine kinase